MRSYYKNASPEQLARDRVGFAILFILAAPFTFGISLIGLIALL